MGFVSLRAWRGLCGPVAACGGLAVRLVGRSSAEAVAGRSGDRSSRVDRASIVMVNYCHGIGRPDRGAAMNTLTHTGTVNGGTPELITTRAAIWSAANN